MDKIWWEKTDGAHRFLRETAEVLDGGKSVVLCLPKHLPWRQTMREVLLDLLERKFSDRTVDVIDAQEISKSPPKYILNNFCDNKEGFRPYNDEAYAEFLAKSRNISLNSRCIWIQNADETQEEDWFLFIDKYHKYLSGNIGGVFILEAGENFRWQNFSGGEIFSYDEKISDYDFFAFNIFLAAEFGRKNNLMKQYLAELLTQFVAGDVELAAACVERKEDFLRNPREVFLSVTEEKNLAPKSDEDIDGAIWLTQLKLIFPLTEIFRRRLIKKYYSAISQALPCNSDNDEKIEQPEQAELGTLVHLVKTEKLWFDKPDWDELQNYRGVRNKLAHLKILPFEELQTLFEENSRR